MEGVPQPLSSILALKPEPHGQSCQVLLLTGAGTWPLVQLHLHQLSVFYGFLHCLDLAVLEFALASNQDAEEFALAQIRLASNSEIHQPLLSEC